MEFLSGYLGRMPLVILYHRFGDVSNLRRVVKVSVGVCMVTVKLRFLWEFVVTVKLRFLWVIVWGIFQAVV